MEAKFTPGPWPIKAMGDGKCILVGVGLVEGPNGYDVAEVYSDDCDRDEAMANARLIAAAHDLYAALEALLDEADDWADTPPGSDDEIAATGAVSLAAGLDRAALAKAHGVTE